MKITKILLLLFFISGQFAFASTAQENKQDSLANPLDSYIDSVRHRYPFINLDLAGVPLLTSRYAIEINIFNGFYAEASYGNKLFDLFQLAATYEERFFGIGTNYKLGINKKRTSFILVGLNEYLRVQLDPASIPNKDLFSMANIGYFHVGKKKPINYFFKAGPLIRTSLKDQYSKGNSRMLGLIAFDVGLGYSFYKIYRKSK